MPEEVLDTQGGYYLEEGESWGNPNCPYKCADNIPDVSNNPYCLNNHDLFISNMGGEESFWLIGISTFILIIFMLAFMIYKTKHKAIEKMIEQGERALRDPSESQIEDGSASYSAKLNDSKNIK